jgi:hypothetical protein
MKALQQQLADHVKLKNGGEGGIRTHDPENRDKGFQDLLLKPLGHLSLNLEYTKRAIA